MGDSVGVGGWVDGEEARSDGRCSGLEDGEVNRVGREERCGGLEGWEGVGWEGRGVGGDPPPRGFLGRGQLVEYGINGA